MSPHGEEEDLGRVTKVDSSGGSLAPTGVPVTALALARTGNFQKKQEHIPS